MSLLLDTCAAIWIGENAPLSEEAVDAIDRANDEGWPVFVSPIIAWELGLLVARGRLSFPMDVENWFDRFIQRSTFRLSNLVASDLIASSFLPGSPPRDPADRILIATARSQDLTLVTRDKLILDYASAGHVRALTC